MVWFSTLIARIRRPFPAYSPSSLARSSISFNARSLQVAQKNRRTASSSL